MEKPSARRQTVSNVEQPAKREDTNNVVSEQYIELLKMLRDNSRKLDIVIELLTKHANIEPEENKLAGCPCAMMRGTIMGNAYISCSSSYRTTSTCTFDGEDYKQCEIYRKTML